MEKNSTIQSVNDFAKTLWNLKAISKATGTVDIKADNKKTIDELLKIFEWSSKFSTSYVSNSSIVEKKIIKDNHIQIWFFDFGISEYEFTVQHLFQLANGLIDHNKLKDSNYSMEFDFVDVGQTEIYKVKGMRLVHKAGEKVETPKFIKGKASSWPYGLENVISIMFGKGSYWTKCSINDLADLFLNEVITCSYYESDEELIKTLRKKEDQLLGMFKLRSLAKIYYLKDDEFEEPDDLNLKELLEKASM